MQDFVDCCNFNTADVGRGAAKLSYVRGDGDRPGVVLSNCSKRRGTRLSDTFNSSFEFLNCPIAGISLKPGTKDIREN